MHKTVRPVPLRRLAFGAFLVFAAPASALAQAGGGDPAPNWLERRVDSLEQGLAFFGREQAPAAPRNVQNAQTSMGDIAVRLDRLENQMRQLNGRLDEIQFQGRKNDEALKRFQGDVDFRFQDIEGKGGGSGGGSKPQRRGDAGDTGGGSGGGSTASLGGRDGGAGSSLGQNRGGGDGGDAIGGLLGGDDNDPNAPMSIRPPGVGASRAPGPAVGGDRMASRGGEDLGVTAGGGSPRDQFDLGVGFVQRRDYSQAEATFRSFLREYPRDPKAPEARYWLGESQYQRKNYTDAVATFLEIYKDAPQSSKAPESMLKLGMSLNGMGQKDQACATLDAAGKKYARIKAQSDREFKRLAC